MIRLTTLAATTSTTIITIVQLLLISACLDTSSNKLEMLSSSFKREVKRREGEGKEEMRGEPDQSTDHLIIIISSSSQSTSLSATVDLYMGFLLMLSLIIDLNG